MAPLGSRGKDEHYVVCQRKGSHGVGLLLAQRTGRERCCQQRSRCKQPEALLWQPNLAYSVCTIGAGCPDAGHNACEASPAGITADMSPAPTSNSSAGAIPTSSAHAYVPRPQEVLLMLQPLPQRGY